jgi:hypothetical protein
MVTSDGPCLVCLTPATITDWTPIREWLTVEGCGCEGFFVSKNLWGSRLVRLRAWERQELAERIRAWRLRGNEAWVTTVGNGMTGPIVITSLRPSLDP